jgi:hypothetical protein
VASQLSEQNAVNLAERYRAWGADSLAALGGWQLAYYEGRFLGLGVGLVAVTETPSISIYRKRGIVKRQRLFWRRLYPTLTIALHTFYIWMEARAIRRRFAISKLKEN